MKKVVIAIVVIIVAILLFLSDSQKLKRFTDGFNNGFNDAVTETTDK